MGRRPKQPESLPINDVAPVTSPEIRQGQMIHLAMNLAEQQLRDGTASAQVITHFLKLGTTLSQLELEKTRNETKLIEAKAKAIEAGERSDIAYAEAIAAFKNYSGQGNTFND